MCDNVHEICAKPFLKGNFVCSPSFLVCARLMTSVHSHRRTA